MGLERLGLEPDCQADVRDDGELWCLLHIVTCRVVKLDDIFPVVYIQNLEKSAYLPPFTLPGFTHTYIYRGSEN